MERSIEIFYADDIEAERRLFKLALSETGIPSTLKMTIDGAKAIEMLTTDSYSPDIIFLDLIMPYKNGLECLKEIRKVEKFKLTPIIILSSTTGKRDIEKAYEEEANLFVHKPFSIDEQAVLMKRILTLDWNIYKPHASRKHFLIGSEEFES